jgi:outer membrane receptor protein involved in Fe transport
VIEALRGVRGVYVSDDRGYPALGFRGLGLPGSYGNRVLVTLDGVPINDDWIWSSYVSYDLRTDLEDIERIEVVRGPGSVVYGASAFSGVVNLVTRYKDVPTSREVGISAVGEGVVRGRARITQRFGGDSGLWLSISGGQSQGRDFFFPEYVPDGPPEVAGFARGLDGARFATLGGRWWWRSLSVAWYLHHQDKHLPTGQFETLFGDARTRNVDTRGLLELRVEPKITESLTSLTRLDLNLYRYRGYFAYSPIEGGVDSNFYDSTWFGAEQRFVFAPSPSVSLSLGAEGQLHPNVHQSDETELDGTYFDDKREFNVAAVYGSADFRLLPPVKLSLGARLDYYTTFGSSLNPRLALIVQPYVGGNLKLLAAKAFKAPSVYEIYGEAIGQLANPALDPENIYSLEVELSQRLGATVTATVAAYANYVSDFISLEEADPSPDGTENLQFRNTDTPVGTLGVEGEIRRDWKEGWMIAAAYSLQRSRYLDSETLGALLSLDAAPELREVPNAPIHLASLKAAAPILSRSLILMSRLSYDSPRYDTSDSDAAGVAQRRSEDAFLWDIVLSGTESRFGLNYSLGVYNAFDSRAEHPVSTEFRQRFIPITGRSLLASANLTF